MEHPVVKFSLCFSTDEDPDEIMSAVGVEWSKTGGTMMFKKQLATFREVTPVVIFRLLNSCTRETIIAEFTAILKDALERMNMEDMEEDGEFRDAVIPPFSLTVKVPKIQGEDTSVFQGWKGRDNWHRKCIHIGVDKEHQKLVLTLVDEAKRCQLVCAQVGETYDSDTL